MGDDKQGKCTEKAEQATTAKERCSNTRLKT